MYLPSVRGGRSVWLPMLLAGCAACAARRGPDRPDADGRRSARDRAGAPSLDPTPVYQSAGLLAVAGPLPFVGSARYLAGPSPDSTLVLLALSFANHGLTFSGEADTPRAAYTVVADVRREGAGGAEPPVRHLEVHEVVRIASLKEAARTDPSIVFQKFLMLAPGAYTLTVSVRDDGSVRSGMQRIPLSVPRLDAGTLSSPVVVYQAAPRSSRDSTPALIANPRATAIFGRDSVVRVYVEGYGLAPDTRLAATVRSSDGAPLWRDTVALAAREAMGAALLDVPISRVGVGQFVLEAEPVGVADTARAPLFVSFFDEGAIATFDDMLSYLRYFAAPDRLDALREAAPVDRAAAWAAFWRATDPVPATPEHEGMRTYFARLQLANARFRDEGEPGWLTDRGEVLITLGEPDDVVRPGPARNAPDARVETWIYSEQRLQLVFVNRTGPGGRWRMTPSSELEFRSAVQRERAR